MRRFLLRIVQLIAFFTLPFLVLVRGAVFFHEQYAANAWVAVFAGLLGSALILFIYLNFFQRLIFKTPITDFGHRRVYGMAFALVFGFSMPGLLYLSSNNVKHESIKESFTRLHPVLRMGISTLIFLDKDLLITDADRVPEDYKAMGLKKKQHSLHYCQNDGYAHAVDIRTIGQSKLRNWMISSYFRLMGFRTLRHIGTADHLHVSLMSHDRPEGI